MSEPKPHPDPERVAALFEEAAELPAPERAPFLERACGPDLALAAEVASLLAAHDEASGFLAPPRDLLAELDAAPRERAGERVGPYRLLSELGRGGMGVVYLAERADGGFEQRVALKCINRAFVSPALAERFLRERQILARLEHPHIARLLDGGVADDGSPYFAMEWVRGEPLIAFCAARKLSLEARLALFDQACRAVAYAHAQLVIHRDLKPSNLMVGEDGNLKLLDFGIARLLVAEEGEEGQLTRLGLQPLTPDYAAPEQRAGRPATTATDVYALGLVLRDLTQGKATGRRLDRDLVAILEQALAPDPAERYSSVEALAEDLRRFCTGLPVRARPATLGYRARKLLSRHRVGFAAAGAAALALVAGLVVSLWQARIAAYERDAARRALSRAEGVQRFLTNLFEGADPAATKGEQITARELLERGAARIDAELADQPAAQVDLLGTLAEVNIKLGRFDQAHHLAERGLELARTLYGPRHAEVAAALNLLGNVEGYQGQFEAAEPRYREALAQQREFFGPRSIEVADSLNDLAVVLQVRSQFAEAEATYRESLEIARELGKEDAEVAAIWSNLSGMLYQAGKLQGAEEAIREALRIWQRDLDPDHLLIAAGYGKLALVRTAQGELTEAEALNRQALETYRRVLGPEHPDVGTRLNNLARVLLKRGDPAGAEPLLREALEIYRKGLGREHPHVAVNLDNLAIAVAKQGRLDEALPLFREALALHKKVRGEKHPAVASSLRSQAEALAAAAREAEALPLAEEAVAILEARPGEPPPELEAIRKLRDELRAKVAQATAAQAVGLG